LVVVATADCDEPRNTQNADDSEMT
jgi:hypothetical protein